MAKKDLDTLEASIRKLRRQMEAELLARVTSLPIDRFAVLIAWAMARYGFGICAKNRTHLVAADGVVKGVVDGQAYVEAWRPGREIKRDDARAFVAEVKRRNLTFGFLVSTAFTKGAETFLYDHHCDPCYLVDMLIRFEAGVRLAIQTDVFRVDTDLFDRLEGPGEEATRVFDNRPPDASLAYLHGPERR
jgi:restriction endonuclease Mrr